MWGLTGTPDGTADWPVDALQALDERLCFDVAAPLAVAFSGGGDSLALLHLAARWATARGRRMLALTVDHGLHPDSAAWTRTAGQQARALGADWRGLAWTGPKPATGLPAAARRARHALIADAARAAGARVVLFGHTADDRLEADRMRLRDAPGLGRVRAWAPSPAWPEGRGVFLLRPLLGARRAELRAWLAARGAAWLDDPANLDPRSARTRARAALAAEAQVEDGGTDDPGAPAAGAGWWATSDGRLLIDRSNLRLQALSAALLSTAGGCVPPRADRLRRLLSTLEQLPSGGWNSESGRRLGEYSIVVGVLAGARVQTLCGAVEFGRESGEYNRGSSVPVALVAGRGSVWDGRFELGADRPGLTVTAVAGSAARLSAVDRARLRAFPPVARGALPLIENAEGGVALPRPFGAGAAYARPLVADRFAAAMGAVAHERDVPDGAEPSPSARRGPDEAAQPSTGA